MGWSIKTTPNQSSLGCVVLFKKDDVKLIMTVENSETGEVFIFNVYDDYKFFGWGEKNVDVWTARIGGNDISVIDIETDLYPKDMFSYVQQVVEVHRALNNMHYYSYLLGPDSPDALRSLIANSIVMEKYGQSDRFKRDVVYQGDYEAIETRFSAIEREIYFDIELTDSDNVVDILLNGLGEYSVSVFKTITDSGSYVLKKLEEVGFNPLDIIKDDDYDWFFVLQKIIQSSYQLKRHILKEIDYALTYLRTDFMVDKYGIVAQKLGTSLERFSKDMDNTDMSYEDIDHIKSFLFDSTNIIYLHKESYFSSTNIFKVLALIAYAIKNNSESWYKTSYRKLFDYDKIYEVFVEYLGLISERTITFSGGKVLKYVWKPVSLFGEM